MSYYGNVFIEIREKNNKGTDLNILYDKISTSFNDGYVKIDDVSQSVYISVDKFEKQKDKIIISLFMVNDLPFYTMLELSKKYKFTCVGTFVFEGDSFGTFKAQNGEIIYRKETDMFQAQEEYLIQKFFPGKYKNKRIKKKLKRKIGDIDNYNNMVLPYIKENFRGKKIKNISKGKQKRLYNKTLKITIVDLPF